MLLIMSSCLFKYLKSGHRKNIYDFFYVFVFCLLIILFLAERSVRQAKQITLLYFEDT